VDPTPLVGRNAELDVLTGLLGAAAAGQSVVALVSGDGGIGKTRLAAELAATARERGFTVLPGRCAELVGAIPYLPLADALRSAAAGPSAGELAEAVAARPVLTQLLPDRPITPAVTSPPSDDAPGLAPQRLFGAVLGMLTELAAASPVLLILEDMHWADDSARDLVTFLSRVLRRERVAMVVSYRTDDLHRQHPLRPVLAELLRLPSVTPLRLGPLDPAAMAAHLTALSGRPLGVAELGQIIRRAGGNPYYAEELLAAAGDPGTVGQALPASLGELLVSRAERLPEAAQQVVQAAAVTGRHVDDELVMLVSGLAAPEYEKAVRQVVAHQLLVPDGPDGYAFRHALLREAVYADLLPGERTRLHARLASVLSDERRLAEVPGTAAELAHHRLASQDLPGALAASVRAAKEAERQGAPADAHRQYERALSLWNQVAEPERVSGTDRNSLAFLSALRAADGGQAGRAMDRLRELISALDGSDPALLCRASERLAYLLAEGGDGDGALAPAEAAVAALPPDPPRWERARALATQASVLLRQRDLGPARLRAGQAQAAAQAAGALRVEADAMVTLGLISEQSGRPEKAVDLLERAHRQAASRAANAGPQQHQVPAERCDCGACLLGAELRAAFHLARARLDLGDPAGAAGPAHEGTRRARKAGLGLAPYGLDLQGLHYLVHYADGAWDHAEQIAGDFAVRATSAGEARLSAVALSVEVARGRTAQVADRIRWLEPFFAADRSAECTARGQLAEHALWQGDHQTAMTQAEAAIRAAQAREQGYGLLTVRPAAVALGALADGAVAGGAVAGGAHQQAPTAADSLLEIARKGAARQRPRDSGAGAPGPGWLARAEAEWLRAVGRNDPAAWQAVVEAFGASSPYETARSRWRLAEALAQAGQHESARREWRLAAQTAGDLGAVPLVAALDDLGRRARLAPALQRSRQSAEQSRGPLARLTTRELEVLQLLAAGRGNKDIGATLFISAKTASLHVSNIMAKLGAASRIEAAAIAHQQGIAAEPRP
jgi:DNA-binding CsgD family transcriptional regulator